jgi:hypothetical protein
MAKDEGMVRISTFVRRDQLAALKAMQDRDGVPVSEQIRRALDRELGTKKKGGKYGTGNATPL